MQSETLTDPTPKPVPKAPKRPNRRARRAVFAKMRAAHRRAQRRLLRAQKAYSCAPEEAQYILLCLDAGMTLTRYPAGGWLAYDRLTGANFDDDTAHAAAQGLISLLEELEAAEAEQEHLCVADERTPGIHPRGDA
jgi:hypothetical protein